MDWVMTFLPMSYREKQSDWFGQKGINWHVSVCIFKDELGNLKVINLKQNNAYYEDILLRKRRIWRNALNTANHYHHDNKPNYIYCEFKLCDNL
jgi:hypothetical protein